MISASERGSRCFPERHGTLPGIWRARVSDRQEFIRREAGGAKAFRSGIGGEIFSRARPLPPKAGESRGPWIVPAAFPLKLCWLRDGLCRMAFERVLRMLERFAGPRLSR